MFAEEQAGNPAKKRADEAKARRIRAKREQEAKEQRKRNELERREREAATITVENENGITSDLEVNRNADTSVAAEISSPHYHSESLSAKLSRQCDGVVYATATHPSAVDASSEVLTATQKAAEQRRVRAEVRARVSAATLVQSIVRSKLISLKTREEQRRVFDKRMADLNALSGILKQSTKTDYIPPPATVSIMTTQFLFFACPISILKQSPGDEPTLDSGTMIIHERDLSRWVNLVKNLLVPGVSGDNLDLDPLLPWMETVEGRLRLQKVLHLCVSSISQKHSAYSKRDLKRPNTTTTLAGDKMTSIDKCYSSIDFFLRIILRLSRQYSGVQRNAVYKKASYLLMQRAAPTECRSSCDLISSLRSILLFGLTRTNPPIPGDAGRLREKCVTTDEKEMASVLLKLVVDFIVSSEKVGTDQIIVNFLCSRFVCEVMTVPLLTWKCWPSSYERLLRIVSSEHLKEKPSAPQLVVFLHRFINMHADLVSEGRIETVLHMTDVSLTTCPAPAVLCLLANLVQLGKTCEEINGMNPLVIHYNAAAEFFNFLSILVNAAPLGTLRSRMSAVEWVSIGSSIKPIVLSDVVCEQVSAVLSDSYVRALFTCAIDDDKLDTKNVINTKTDKDEKHEKDLVDIGMSSAASIAAKEAMIDRNRSIWNSSKWAKQLSALISGPREKKHAASRSTDSRGVGKLMNTSSLSRQLANGQGSIKIPVTSVLSSHDASHGRTQKSPQHHEYSISLLMSLCRFYGTVISRWGGHGKEDLIRRGRKPNENSKVGKDIAVASVEPCITALLNVLCFSTSFITSSWATIQSNPIVVTDLYDVIDINKRTAPIRTLTAHQSYRHLQHSQYGVVNGGNVGALILLMFVTCLSHTLIVTDDVEIHDLEKPLPKHQLRRCIVLIKKLLYRACCLDDIHEATTKCGEDSNYVGLALISSSSKLQNELYTRSSRRLLCAPKLWIEEGLLEEDLRKCRTHSDYIFLLSTPVCRLCPFLISFKRRLKLFERIVTTNREDIQGSNEQRNLKPGIMVKVMRGRVLEDGLTHLNKLGRHMRQRIVISYISEAGARETGIDVGGLFKEFWSDLSNLAFDPNYALFKNTEGFLMYPNPTSRLAHGADHVVLFEFLGRILGKALYEGITIQPQFAHLFLSFLRGDHNYLHLLTDLSTIDPQLYGNLMFLKNYDGDVSDLCLTFTVSHDDFGVQEVPLIVGGEDMEVTNENKRRYIYLVAKHHVSDRIKEQSDAFTRGLWDVIDSSWLRLFNEPELQVLISGASDGKIDVTDMKSNTRYTGGYSRLDRNVVRFWNVVSSFSPKNQADLLRFVTSCERPPPLGFGSMNPPFTIQRVGIMRDADKLPTASTCFNTLKLPTYSSEKVLREKLLYSIGAGAGFELT